MQTQMISKEAKTQIPFFKSWWCQTSILLDPLHLQPALPMVLPSVSDGAFSTLVWANQSVAVQVWQFVWQVGPGQDASCLPRVHKTHLSITHSSNQRKKMGHERLWGLFLPCYLVSGASFDEIFFKDVVQCRVQLLPYILDQKGASKRQTIFQVVLEVLMVHWGDLGSEKHVRHLTGGSFPFLSTLDLILSFHKNMVLIRANLKCSL